MAEAWQKRRYQAAFVAKLTDSMAEAGETQCWPKFASDCHYLEYALTSELSEKYRTVLKTLQAMAHHAPSWCYEERTPYNAMDEVPS